MNFYIDIIVDAADQDAANQMCVDISGNEADRATFMVPLYPIGNPEMTPTHYGTQTAEDATYLSIVGVYIESGAIGSAIYVTRSIGSSTFIDTNAPAVDADPGDAWTFDMTAALLGVERRNDLNV